MLSPSDFETIKAVIAIEDSDAAINELLDMYTRQSEGNIEKLLLMIPSIASKQINILNGSLHNAYDAGTSIARTVHGKTVSSKYVMDYDVLAYFVGRHNFLKYYNQAMVPNSNRRMLKAAEVSKLSNVDEMFVKKFIEFIDKKYPEYRDERLYSALHTYGIETMRMNSWIISGVVTNWLYDMEYALRGVVDMCEWCYTNRDKWDDLSENVPGDNLE